MKKTIAFFSLIICIAAFSSCGMKECRCYSTNRVTQNDSIIENITDTVPNFTRGNCEDFNKEETLSIDSVTFIHHTLTCIED